MKVSITPREDPDVDITLTDVDGISFIDDNSHGKGTVFGICEATKGKKIVLISSPGVVCVEVDV